MWMFIVNKTVTENVSVSHSNSINTCLPFYDLMQKHINAGTGKRSQPVLRMSLVGAYAFRDYIAVTTEADGLFG